MKFLTFLPVLFLSFSSFSQLPMFEGERIATINFDTIYPNASRVDFDSYLALAMKVNAHRAERMIAYENFKQMALDSNTVILDTRSKAMYDAQHVKGAIHLNFSDFNVWSLATLIPDTNTRILIYCNNNFDYTKTNIPISEQYFVSKSAPLDIEMVVPIFSYPNGPKEFPLTMALNVPTYINLYGYGYKNVYELADLIPVYYGDIKFEGTAIDENTGHLK